MRSKAFRPNLDDVENLSYGKGAKKNRGTGSRHICHRLNTQERKLYELAKRSGFLTVRGTGYRKERKGSPVCNTYRQRCDALDEICIIIEKRMEHDTVVIDFSTLRVMDDTEYASTVVEHILKANYPQLIYEDSTIRSTLIDWDAVRTKPIWDINERLIKVECDRDEAKALAAEVWKESSNFVA